MLKQVVTMVVMAVAFLRAEHDHAVAECELGMCNHPILTRHHQMLLEAERSTEPVNRRGRVSITKSRYYRRFLRFCTT